MTRDRCLPVYLVLDVSGSMVGDPINQVKQGVLELIANLNGDPYALETAYLSVITFESSARQIVPLTELGQFKEDVINKLGANGGTSMGEALKVLDQAIDREVRKTTESQKGDWKPLVFLMTDGQPTDSWQGPADAIKKKRHNIIACAAGSGADVNVLKRVTEIVVQLNTQEPDAFRQFFKWVSSSISSTSASVAQVAADNAPVNLPPPPPVIQIVP